MWYYYKMHSFFQECNKIFFDHIPCHWFNIYTDADEQMIKDFRTEAQLSPSTSDKQIFENLELFTGNGTAKNGAAMFFGKQPERKFPHAITRCVLFKGTNKVYIIDDKTFGGSLYQQYLHAMGWLESKLQVAYKIEGAGPREEIWEIPLTVFKEAIINALSHRDYYEQGANIMIEMFDDRVEISNPGGLLPIVAKDFGHKSMTRNPLIFGLFTRLHLVEKVASGIPRMQKAMREANLPEPEFRTEGMFTAVFKRGIHIKHKTENVLSLSQACPKLNTRYIPIAEQIISYCSEPHSIQEIMGIVRQTNRSRFKKNIINPLLEEGILFMTIPDKPNSPLQQYCTTK